MGPASKLEAEMIASTTYVGRNRRDIVPTEGEQDVAHDVLMQTAALQETRSRVGKQVSRTDEYKTNASGPTYFRTVVLRRSTGFNK
jgi:hypothetical protein